MAIWNMKHENVCYLKLVRLNEDVILEAISIKKRKYLKGEFFGIWGNKNKMPVKIISAKFY